MITYESQQAWFEDSMQVFMITYLLDAIIAGDRILEHEMGAEGLRIFWGWFDDVDMCTGAFGK
jgi:hypothetical protein